MGPFEFFENNELSPYAKTTMATEMADQSIMAESDTDNSSTVLDLKPRAVHEESVDDVDADMGIGRASTTLSGTDLVFPVASLWGCGGGVRGCGPHRVTPSQRGPEG